MAVALLKALTPFRVGGGILIRFAIKHYYIFILLVVLLPAIFGSVRLAIEQQNPTIPLVMLGTTLANADANIADDVVILKENPTELIGMEKPTEGIWKNICYYWGVFKVAFRELGWIWAIAFPFVILYKIFRIQGSKGFQSSISADFTKAVVWGLLFIFVVNLLMITTGFLDGSLISNFPEEISQFTRYKLVAIQALPFHGLTSLVMYLATLF